jgi:GT2 family glycosyltransferase
MGIELYKFTYGKKIFEFAGGACAVRKSIWKNRPFNENLLAGEDAEYSWYLHLIGYDIIYNPEIKSLHEHKIVKLNIKEKNFFKFDKWNFMFKMNIWNYWFKRLLFSDPYKDFRYKNEK